MYLLICVLNYLPGLFWSIRHADCKHAQIYPNYKSNKASVLMQIDKAMGNCQAQNM